MKGNMDPNRKYEESRKTVLMKFIKIEMLALHFNEFAYFDYSLFLLSSHTHIYIYIFTNQISTSIHGTRKKPTKKQKKPWPGTRDKNISNHGPEEKEKSFLGKKERKDQPRPTP